MATTTSPDHVLDDVFRGVLDSYLRYGACEDDRRGLRGLLSAFGRAADTQFPPSSASAERAMARAEVVAGVAAARGAAEGNEALGSGALPPILIRAAAHRPSHGWDGPETGDDGAVWEALSPSDFEALETSVLAGYMAKIKLDLGEEERGLAAEAYVQFFAGNVIAPEYMAAFAAWYARLDKQRKAKTLRLLRRVQGALAGSPSLRASFPWRSTVFAAFASESLVTAKARAAAAPPKESFATLYTRSGVLGVHDTEDDDDVGASGANALDLRARYTADRAGTSENPRPDSPVIAGLSTNKINLQHNDARSARFDAHGQTTLTARQLDAMTAAGKKPPPARSVYAQSYEYREPASKAFSTLYSKDLQKSVRLGLDREMRLETTYGAAHEALATRVLEANAAAGVTPNFDITEPSDEAYKRLLEERKMGTR